MKSAGVYLSFAFACAFVLGFFRAPEAITSFPVDAIAQTNSGLGFVSSEPADGSEDVLVDSDVYLQFSQPLNDAFEELQISFEPPAEMSF
ncbi:MAG: hypothetical protein AAFY15_02170, partial [Cyanobacteria bacterium J06648_11]